MRRRRGCSAWRRRGLGADDRRDHHWRGGRHRSPGRGEYPGSPGLDHRRQWRPARAGQRQGHPGSPDHHPRPHHHHSAWRSDGGRDLDPRPGAGGHPAHHGRLDRGLCGRRLSAARRRAAADPGQFRGARARRGAAGTAGNALRPQHDRRRVEHRDQGARTGVRRLRHRHRGEPGFPRGLSRHQHPARRGRGASPVRPALRRRWRGQRRPRPPPSGAGSRLSARSAGPGAQ